MEDSTIKAITILGGILAITGGLKVMYDYNTALFVVTVLFLVIPIVGGILIGTIIGVLKKNKLENK